ncbi:phosphate butyryltransferase [Faecalicatena contorta]|uniref:phosphate butyryltransferase n=1 Tax=Lachnospiraceae TaxID=186803 RepID=UPI001F3F6E29|nr:phosphate butyryltransferase [Faecalicatena contorta]MCF2667651.1 phosphate butyryltransferase [Faecalicatena contorta]
MIRSFKELIEKVQNGEPQTLSVAVAQDADVLLSVWNAYQNRIIQGAYLVGNEKEIREIAKEQGIDLSKFEIVNEEEKPEACAAAIKLVREGKASLPMKGFVDTSVALKALLNKEYGLRTGNLICHVGLMEVAGFDRMFLLSDSAMTIAPTLEQKVDLIKACTQIAHAMGNDNPKVAVLCAVEKVNPKMPATLDAAELTRMNEEGEITGCMVKGPLAMDNAVSVEAARHKGIDHPVAGNADILITPDIEAGNILNKSMEYFAKCEKAGCIMGAAKPMVLTSRASSDTSKMNSIALAVLAAQAVGKN